MSEIRPAVAARIAHEIEFGFRAHGSTEYRARSNQEKLYLTMCCHYRFIPFRFLCDAYIPPRDNADEELRDVISSAIDQAEAEVRPPSYPPPGPKAPSGPPARLAGSSLLPQRPSLTETANQKDAAEDAARVAGDPIASANASAAGL
eukprot:6275368-Karenia_brevis.AAC.1